MLGNPKYKLGEKVKFTLNGKETIGEVYIIDAYGTFEQNQEVSYDVMVDLPDNQKCLYKHVIETCLTKADD